MTLSDPLLKELKGHIAKLASAPGPYDDENESVFLICHCLECIFRKGVIRYDGFTPWKADCFQWFYQFVRKYQKTMPLVFKVAFDNVLSDTKTKTSAGKSRLLIRTCLKRRCLHIPIQFHIDNHDYNDQSLRINYNQQTSILGHEILSQILLSLVMQLSSYNFNVDLSNSSFLDESWQIPTVIKTELVPSQKLGLTLGFPLGFAVIVEIAKNSLASEMSDKISIGDIIDEINGNCVRHMFGSKIESLLRKYKCQPLYMSFIKCRDARSGQIYLPVIKLYRILGLSPELYEEQNNSGDCQQHLNSNRESESAEKLSLSEQFNQLSFDSHSNPSQAFPEEPPIFPRSKSPSTEAAIIDIISNDLISEEINSLANNKHSSGSSNIISKYYEEDAMEFIV